MTTWLAGQTITDTALNDQTPVAGSLTQPTAATSWTVSSFTSETTPGGTVHWYLIMTYSGATLTGSATGSVTASTVATFDSASLPAGYYYPGGEANGAGGGTAGPVFARVSPTTGVLLLNYLLPTATLKSGDAVNFSGSWEAA